MASRAEALDPFDERLHHRFTYVNGQRYSQKKYTRSFCITADWKKEYLYAEPESGQYRATAILIHGWPDLSFGWRYQIPMFLENGIRVVCPDLLGFGGTDVPQVPPNDLSIYGQKRASEDIKELALQLGSRQIILGGHDWGGAVVYRCAQWHPELVSHVFSVCTPYAAPTKHYVSLDMVVERAPQFGYQKHLASSEVEDTVKSREEVRQFLHGMYGGRGINGETLFEPEKGVLLHNMAKVTKTKLLTDKEMDYYVNEYFRTGLHGSCNWYRTRYVNWKDEQSLLNQKIQVPVLFIQASKDNVLLPSMSAGMERHITHLTRRQVDAAHWALWQAPAAVNAHLQDWLDGVVFGAQAKL